MDIHRLSDSQGNAIHKSYFLFAQPYGSGAIMTSEVSKPSDFVPALIVVDMQEDFCPPVCTAAVILFSGIL